MSGIINKVKDALSGDHQHTTTTGHTTGNTTTGYTNTGHTGTAEGVTGPHSSRIANAADPRVDSDRDGSYTTGGTTAGHTTGPTAGTTYGTGATTAEGTSGPHSSRIGNAIDPRVDSDRDGSHHVGGSTTGYSGGNTTTGYGAGQTAEGVSGPHSSRLANAVDPRVDSDRDGSHHVGGSTTGYSGGNTTTGYGAGQTAEGVSGPHSSRLANAVDPRVDSDRDGSHHVGGATTTGTGYGTTTGGGMHSSTTTAGNTGTTGHGPHSSSLLNKLDPRVDSTTGAMKSSTTSGTTGTTGTTGTHNTHSTMTGTGHTGTMGGLSSSTNAGPHNSNMANKMDPRVDSDLDGRGNRHGAATGGVFGASGSHATPGRGTAQNTAGPHNSDLANQIDPRVDSDMDGSGTVGGNRTYASTGHRDPMDAAHVPPSVLRESIGDPTITHSNPGHNHQGRHGSTSHQDAHRGI